MQRKRYYKKTKQKIGLLVFKASPHFDKITVPGHSLPRKGNYHLSTRHIQFVLSMALILSDPADGTKNLWTPKTLIIGQ